MSGSLPHRQLRSDLIAWAKAQECSLPHRQLRRGGCFGPSRKAVHCRTGSLEVLAISAPFIPVVHCRTGSLEVLQKN